MLHFNLLIEYGVKNLISIFPDGSELIMDNGFRMITGGSWVGCKTFKNIGEIGFSASNRYDN